MGLCCMLKPLLEYKWTLSYILLHVLTIIGLKWYTKDMLNAHKSLEFKRKHAPFIRKDLHILDFTRSLWWLTVWPRFIFYFSWVAFWFLVFMAITAG